MNKQEIENKIKELQEELKRLEEGNSFKWRAPYNDYFFYLNSFNDIINRSIDLDFGSDNTLFIAGNYFKTEELAKEYQEYLKALHRVKIYIKENDLWFRPDYDNDMQSKWLIGYQYKDKKYIVGLNYSVIADCILPVFKEKEHAEQVIDNCKQDLDIIFNWHKKNL
jgi:sugar-specific transcriptional regulator TrmB